MTEKENLKEQQSKANNRTKHPDLAKLMDRLRKVFKEAKVTQLKEKS